MVKVLFVCSGNICRSPTAEAVFRAAVARAKLSDTIEIDSAGTGDYHIGEPPDPRAREAARRRGFKLDHLRARQVTPEDFLKYDYVLAMDRANYEDLARICPAGHEYKLYLFLDFHPYAPARDVPDPYYSGPDGFETVLDLIEETSPTLLAHIQKTHFNP